MCHKLEKLFTAVTGINPKYLEPKPSPQEMAREIAKSKTPIITPSSGQDSFDGCYDILERMSNTLSSDDFADWFIHTFNKENHPDPNNNTKMNVRNGQLTPSTEWGETINLS